MASPLLLYCPKSFQTSSPPARLRQLETDSKRNWMISGTYMEQWAARRDSVRIELKGACAGVQARGVGTYIRLWRHNRRTEGTWTCTRAYRGVKFGRCVFWWGAIYSNRPRLSAWILQCLNGFGLAWYHNHGPMDRHPAARDRHAHVTRYFGFGKNANETCSGVRVCIVLTIWTEWGRHEEKFFHALVLHHTALIQDMHHS